MKFGVNTSPRPPFNSREAYQGAVQTAEKLGYDFFSVSDHVVVPKENGSRYPYNEEGKLGAATLGHCFDQLTTLAFLAGCTDRIRLLSPVRAVTLNGIAQGFAADRAVTALRQHGIEHALVNLGEVGCLGRKPSDEDWTVGVQHPRVAEAYVSLAALNGRSLATSGDYETKFTDDFAKHHIFDPRSGQSPTELASASIAAPTALQADALSTTAMVLGPERTLALIESLPNVDALLVLKNGRSLRTPGFIEVTETG